MPSPQPAVTSDGPSRMLSQHSGALDRTSNRTPGHHTASSFDITADRKTENEDVDREDSNPLENARCSSIPVPSQGEPTPFKTLSDRPYFAIYFFSCETMEGFRTQHRKSVKLWIDKNTEQQIDWLLVLVTQVSESATQEKLIKKFCDKLRSETIGFQDSKTTKAKDRFARICTGTSAARGAVFEESWGVIFFASLFFFVNFWFCLSFCYFSLYFLIYLFSDFFFNLFWSFRRSKLVYVKAFHYLLKLAIV